MTILYSVLVVGAVGLIIGIMLCVAGKFLSVTVDERITKIREQLPSNNCGACGYAGCDAYAKAIVEDGVPAGLCPGANSEENLRVIGEVMGISVEAGEKMVMHVKCAGKCGVATKKYNYHGELDCRQAAVTPGRGPKACEHGCMGFGSCVKACNFDAIKIVDGVAVIDEEKCINCGKCMAVCPNSVIERIPYKAARKTKCNNKDKGKPVKDICASGCIGCTLCSKVCPEGAIVIENNLPVIDLSKCTQCGVCVEKCPTKVIS